LRFKYTWVKGEPAEAQEKPVVLTNTTALPLKFKLTCVPPFSVGKGPYTLEPGASTEVMVGFAPDYRHDMQSQKLDDRLHVKYADHPRKDSVGLACEINYPNLHLEYVKRGRCRWCCCCCYY